jgi:hypothetical protein
METHKLRLSFKRAKGRIFETKGEKVTGGRIKQHNEEIHDFNTYQVLG